MTKLKVLIKRIATIITGQRGVTLIEVAMGLGVLGLIGVLFASTMATAVISVSISEEKVNMNNLARAQMEYTKNSPYVAYIYGSPDIPPSYAELDDPGNPDAIIVPEGYSIDVSASALNQPDDGIQEITVTVSKNDNTLMVKGYKVNR